MVSCIKEAQKGIRQKVKSLRVQGMWPSTKKYIAHLKGFTWEMDPNYEGSYIVKKVFSAWDLILTMMDGYEFPLCANSDVVKK